MTASAPAGPHSLKLRVYYEDTDAGGIVYHAAYLRFAERARTEFLRAHGVDHRQLLAVHGGQFVVTRCEIDFRAAARLDELLTVVTEIAGRSGARLTMRQHVLRGEVLVAELMVSLAFLSPQLRPKRLPDVMTSTPS